MKAGDGLLEESTGKPDPVPLRCGPPRYVTTHAEGAVELHLREIAPEQELQHRAVTGPLHQAPSDLQTALRNERVNLRRVVAGHEEVAVKVPASLEQARVVHLPVSVQTGSGTLCACGVRRVLNERRPELRFVFRQNLERVTALKPDSMSTCAISITRCASDSGYQ